MVYERQDLSHLAITLAETILAFVAGSAWLGIGLWLALLDGVRAGRSLYQGAERYAARDPGADIRRGSVGITSKVALGVTLVFFIVFFNVYHQESSAGVLANARMLGASKRQLLRYIYLHRPPHGCSQPARRWAWHSSARWSVSIWAPQGRGPILQAEGVFDIDTVIAGIPC
jgi:NitT/TauT family transport system permease protein